MELVVSFYEEDPLWVLSRIDLSSNRVEFLAQLVKYLIKKNREKAIEFLRQMASLASTADDFWSVATLLNELNSAEAEEYYIKSLDMVCDGRNLSAFAKLNFSKALEYAEKMTPKNKAMLLCMIAISVRDWALFESGKEQFLKYDSERWFLKFYSSDFEVFGREKSIEMARSWKDPEYRMGELMRLAREYLKDDPKLSVTLAKEAITIASQQKSAEAKINGISHFLFHQYW